jgi:hypothetical protein
MKPRTFGEILDGAFQIYRRHAVALALLTLVAYGVRALVMLGLMGSLLKAGPEPNPAVFLAFFPIWLIGMTTTVFAWGGLTWEASEAYLGEPVSVRDGLRAGLRSFLRLLGTLFFSTLLVYACFIPVGFVAALLIGVFAAVAGTGGGTLGVVAGVIVGTVAAVAGGFTLVAAGGWLACAVPITVIEGVGPFRAIGRSFELARGAVLRSGALMLVAGLIVMLPAIGVLLLSGQLSLMFTSPGAQLPLSGLLIQQLGALAASLFTTPFLLSVMTVLYYDRRVRGEALDVELAAHELAVSAEPAAF